MPPPRVHEVRYADCFRGAQQAPGGGGTNIGTADTCLSQEEHQEICCPERAKSGPGASPWHFYGPLLAMWKVSSLPLGGKRMSILRTRFQKLWPWLILATVGLVCVVGLIVYGSRPTTLPTPEQLCRKQLGSGNRGLTQSREPPCSRRVSVRSRTRGATLRRRPAADMNRVGCSGYAKLLAMTLAKLMRIERSGFFAPSRYARTNYA